MPSKSTQNVSQTEHLDNFANDQVASGRFRSAGEVVPAALRLLERELKDSPKNRRDEPEGPADVPHPPPVMPVDGTQPSGSRRTP